MKKIFLLFSISTIALAAHAQQRISDGTAAATINNAAVLELQSTNKGFLPSRVALADRLTWAPMAGTATKGMVIYNTATGGANGLDTGLVVWEGVWNPIANGSQKDYWRLTGNTGTTSPTTVGSAVGSANFWGTTDNKNLAIGTNNTTRVIFDQSGNASGGYGTSTLGSDNFVWGYTDTTVFGSQANAVFGQGNSTGAYSTGYNLVSGFSNKIYGNYTIAGGLQNYELMSTTGNLIAGESNSVTNNFNVIAGVQNMIGSTAIGVGGNAVFGTANKDSAIYGLTSGLNNVVGTSANYSSVLGESLTMNGNHAVATGLFNTDSANYTFVAGQSNTIGSGASGTAVLGASNKITGASTNSIVSGSGNTVSGLSAAGLTSSIVTGTNNRFIAVNAALPSSDLILGGSDNMVTDSRRSIVVGRFDTISGISNGIVVGRLNYDSITNYTAIFGSQNRVTGNASYGSDNNIVAGTGNVVYTDNVTAFATNNAVFGYANKDSTSYIIAAGSNNKISPGANNSAVFGGSNNNAAPYSIVGGMNNILTANGGNSLLMGGGQTAAEGNYLSGSRSAVFGTSNKDSANQTFIAGSNNAIPPVATNSATIGTGLTATRPNTLYTNNIDNGGSFATALRVITASDSAYTTDYTLVCDFTGSTAITISLPDPATCKNRIYKVVSYNNAGVMFSSAIKTLGGTMPALTATLKGGQIVGSFSSNGTTGGVPIGSTTTIQSNGTSWYWVGL